MSVIIDPDTYVVSRRPSPDWHTTLGSLCVDIAGSAVEIEDAIQLDRLATSEEAARDAETLIRAASVFLDAMMAFEKRYVRAE